MDTIRYIGDTLFVKASEMVSDYTPAIENKGAGWTDVIITIIVCATIAIVTIYGCKQFFTWKIHVYDQDIAQKKEKWEWEVADIKRKQVAEYRNKELDLLKEEKGKCLEKIDSYIQDLQKP